MEKWMEIVLILLLALAIAGMIMLSGCTASADNYGNDGQQYTGIDDSAGAAYSGNRNGMLERGGFGNITDAQRQQMMQTWAAACDGKAAGDACFVQGAQGEINGTCSARDGNMTCMPSGMGGRGAPGGQPQGNGTQGGFGQPPQNP